ncbi:MAG: PrgI family protein [Oribacterium sp.]|nr:PrgI family protein [Oribacterium sp.]
MIKADIPQDVTEYKEQFFFGLTTRQIVCVVLMLALAIPSFLFLRGIIRTDILMYLLVFEAAPLAAVGFFKYNGMGFEIIAKKVVEFYFGNQRRRMKYQPEETEAHDLFRKIYLLDIEEIRRKEKKGRKHHKINTSVPTASKGTAANE